jgi:hypothetical protein
LGDLTRFAGGNAWFDARRADELESAAPHPAFGSLVLTGGGRTITQHLFHPTVKAPNGQWTRFSGRVTAEAFDTDEATFRSVLKNVNRVTLTVEAVSNQRETIGLDNFTLQAR